MICRFGHGNLLKRLFLGKVRSCVNIIYDVISFGALRNGRYFQPYRYVNTNTIHEISNITDTADRLPAEIFPLDTEGGIGVATTVERRITTAMAKYPNLTQVPRVQLKTSLCHLCDLGFSVDDGIEMVNKCTDILKKKNSELLKSILGIRQCKFSDEELLDILRSSPEYLLVDHLVIVSRYNSLRNYFSHKLVKRIFSNCTGLAQMKWVVIEKKLEYLINDMHVPMHEIAQSKVLDRPLDEIRARHLFLERAGLFKKPDRKSNIPHKNHKLALIMDPEDEYFAMEIAGLTAEEYLVFQELVPLEDKRFTDDDVEVFE